MKKQLKKILVLLLLVVLLAGCTFKTEVGMVIDSNEDVEVSILYMMDDEMIDSMISMSESGEETSSNKTYTDAERWKYLESDDSMDVPEGYKTEKYDKNGFKGYKATKDAGKLSELSTASATERVNILSDEDDDPFAKNLFIKDGNKYKSNMKADLGDEASQMESYESYGAMFEFNLVVTLPVKPTSHNATSVSKDGKTLTYNLLKTQNIEFEFELDGKGSSNTNNKTNNKSNKSNSKENGTTTAKSLDLNLPLIIGLGAAILVLIIVIVVLIIVLSKKKSTPKVENTTPEVPQETTNTEETTETKED